MITTTQAVLEITERIKKVRSAEEKMAASYSQELFANRLLAMMDLGREWRKIEQIIEALEEAMAERRSRESWESWESRDSK